MPDGNKIMETLVRLLADQYGMDVINVRIVDKEDKNEGSQGHD